MMNKQTLEHELRRVSRPRIPPEFRDRVLRAVPAPSCEGVAPLAAVPRVAGWRFLAVATSLVAVVAAGLWRVLPQPGGPLPRAEGQRVQVVRPAGDDVVVFWLDDETPVFVELSK